MARDMVEDALYASRVGVFVAKKDGIKLRDGDEALIQ